MSEKTIVSWSRKTVEGRGVEIIGAPYGLPVNYENGGKLKIVNEAVPDGFAMRPVVDLSSVVLMTDFRIRGSLWERSIKCWLKSTYDHNEAEVETLWAYNELGAKSAWERILGKPDKEVLAPA